MSVGFLRLSIESVILFSTWLFLTASLTSRFLDGFKDLSITAFDELFWFLSSMILLDPFDLLTPELLSVLSCFVIWFL